MGNKISISDKVIGLYDGSYYIAEIGSNFDGDLNRAKDLINLAQEAGANAAKFQHYTAKTLISNMGFQKIGNGNSHQSSWDKSVYDTYEKASLNSDWTRSLAEECSRIGIDFITSPYSIELVDLVEDYVCAYKIGSGDITWTQVIEHIAKKKKPVLLATGASTKTDVARAMSRIYDSGNENVVIMQCNTNYEVGSGNERYQNIRVLESYKLDYPEAILGFSDHTQGNESMLAAYTLGARVFEKHFTDDRNRSGPDHGFALTKEEFKEAIERINELEIILGSTEKKIEENELQTFYLQRRSLYSVNELNQGDVISKESIIPLRPFIDGGYAPYEINELIGRRALRRIKAGDLLTSENVEIG